MIDVAAPAGGFVTAIDTRAIGLVVVALGGGRLRADDAIDARVGLSAVIGRGASVHKGAPLACVHARSRAEAIAAREAVLAAITIGERQPTMPPPVLWTSAPPG